MQCLTPEMIDRLQEDDLQSLSELDAAGIISKPGESFPEFKNRLCSHLMSFADFNRSIAETGEFALFEDFTLHEKDRIGDEIIKEASAVTEKLYHFSINWVPGFFLSKSVGLLWGGCAIHIPEEHLTVFLIRKNFATRKRWFIYRREELLAHELCHAARSPLKDVVFEEFFAYQTAPSRIRRYLGNCFRTQLDALLFVLPVMLLLAVQLVDTFTSYRMPVWIFWIIALACPAFMLLRNQLARNFFYKARKSLLAIPGAIPEPILFRCTRQEIKAIAGRHRDASGLMDYIQERTSSELRWKVICNRFILKGNDTAADSGGTSI
ncbi:MAG: hypothetical protein WCV67_01230 [Victivallaceae bacterium]|jgi:hypothetical protein